MDKHHVSIRFGERVRSLRKSQGFSQEGFSNHCEINRTYMGAIERGEKTPSLLTITKIADGLNITLRELFDY